MMQKWARYLTPTARQRRLGLTCLGVGHQEDIAPCRPRVLDCYAAVLVVEGNGRLRVGPPGTTYELVAPVLFWLFPGVEHAYGPNPDGWEEMWTLFGGSAAEAYEDLGYLSRTGPVMPFADSTAVRYTFDRLLDCCRKQSPGVEVKSAQLVHDLIITAQDVQNDPNGPGDATILAELRERAHSPMSVSEHAARLGLSLRALRRAVRRGAGCTPKDYILQIRLNHAKTLLAQSDLPVAEVGREVGHDDPAYFTRIFTRRSGMSPRAFRNQQQRQYQ